MAVLSSNDRQAVTDQLLRDLSVERNGPGTLTKAEVRTAVNATDQFQEDEAANYNATLSASAQAQLDARQKSHMFRAVSEKRYGVL